MFSKLLADRLGGLVALSPGQIASLESHYGLLVRWNKVLNLTSVRNIEEAVERHYCESLFLGAHLPPGVLAIADIGSGAGFPGLPVAILRADCTVTLIESHQRKAVFLREASRTLANLRVIARRAEEIEAPFDWAISRAVNAADIAKVLARLAPHAALLAGDGDIPSQVPAFRWAEPIRLPWGDRRFLWVGENDASS